MARILHTADVHLRPDADERAAALDAVLETASDLEVDAVTIGGDLFDTDRAAEQLRSELRSVFSGWPFTVLCIPGNHDRESFRGDLHYGEDFVPMTTDPFDMYHVGETRLVTIPYQRELTDDLLYALQDREPFAGPECLLLHCSLEAPVDSHAGDEGEVRYFPVTKRELAELDFAYYLAGHYHTAQRVAIPNGGVFVYAGTPASTTSAEEGRRSVTLVDTAAEEVSFHELDTYYVDTHRATVTPGSEDDVLAGIRDRAADWAGDEVDARIELDGFTDRGEGAFLAAVRGAAAEADAAIDYDVRTVQQLVDHPLYRAFEDRLAERDEVHAETLGDDYDLDAFHEATRHQVMAVCTELLADGRLT